MPLVIGIDDDRGVLDDLLGDLRLAVRRAEQGPVEVLGFGSVGQAATALREDLAGRAVALFVVGHTTEGLGRAARFVRRHHPASLVIALGVEDSQSADDLARAGLVHDVLGRPWRPAAASFEPVVVDAVEQWAAARTTGSAIVLIGRAGHPPSYRIRDLFTRNPVPHLYLDREETRAHELLETLGADALPVPIVVAPDGTVLSDPTPKAMWEALGESVNPSRSRYDVVVVGAGPAGLAVVINAASEGLSVLLLDYEAPGGQAGSSSRIENYAGFPSGVSGTEIGRRATNQARRLGAELAGATPVDTLAARAGGFVVASSGEFEVGTDAVVIAVGLSWNKLDVEGAERFEGSGLFYGAARSEARHVAGRRVVVVGGANSAGQAAVYFAEVAAEVVVVVRGTDLGSKMSQYLVEQIAERDNIVVRLEAQITRVDGDTVVDSVEVTDPAGTQSLPTAGVFVFIGARPRTAWLPDWLVRDDRGFVLTGAAVGAEGEYATSTPGLFCVGDVRAGSVKRVASAIGEGSVVVPAIHRHLARTRATVAAATSPLPPLP